VRIKTTNRKTKQKRMEHTQKRVQAPQTAASSRAYNDIIKAKPTEIAKPKPASPIAPQHTVADLKAI